VAESRQQLQTLSDEALGDALRSLGRSVALPSASGEPGQSDVAARARVRIVALDIHPGRTGTRRWFGLGLRPMRRGLVLALAALLVLAAIAGAVGLGLPGLRIIFGDVPSPRPTVSAAPSAGSASASASLAPLGSSLGIGTALPLADVERLAGFDVLLPSDPAIGPPDVSYLSGERAALVWATRPGLPPTEAEGIGLLISEFQGHVDDGYVQKILNSDTKLTPVTVSGSPGYWIHGDPHYFFYIDRDGKPVDDSHRVVGDVLMWRTGDVTYRLESGLGMDDAIRLAESLK
jgi:hypothetical protein